MIEEHKQLRETITAAEAQARGMYEKGQRGLENTVRTLRQAGREVDDRLRALNQAVKDEQAAAARAKATPPPPPSEPPPTDQPTRGRRGNRES